MFIVILYLLISNAGLILIKYGTTNFTFNFTDKMINMQFNVFLILGLLLYVCSFVMYTVVLSKFSLSYIMPLLTGISYTITIIASVIFFKEKINMYQWIGILVIFSGIILMNIKSS